MDDELKYQNDPLRDSSLAFFGAITASVSHELNNVIAIMDQTTGLLEDRLTGSEEEIKITAEKLARIVTSLQAQAARGLGIIKRLNRFAHSADQPRQKFDVNETLDNLIELSRRLAVLRGVTLESRPAEDPGEIESNPFYLQQAVFAAIRMILSSAHKGDILTIAINRGGGRVEIIVEGPAGTQDGPVVDPADIQRIMEALSGSAELQKSPEKITVRLELPG
jgi:C4-dicarboxylate-specific signal transduction histidine kinase